MEPGCDWAAWGAGTFDDEECGADLKNGGECHALRGSDGECYNKANHVEALT